MTLFPKLTSASSKVLAKTTCAATVTFARAVNLIQVLEHLHPSPGPSKRHTHTPFRQLINTSPTAELPTHFFSTILLCGSCLLLAGKEIHTATLATAATRAELYIDLVSSVLKLAPDLTNNLALYTQYKRYYGTEKGKWRAVGPDECEGCYAAGYGCQCVFSWEGIIVSWMWVC